MMKMKLLRHEGVNPLFVSFEKASNEVTFFEWSDWFALGSTHDKLALRQPSFDKIVLPEHP